MTAATAHTTSANPSAATKVASAAALPVASASVPTAPSPTLTLTTMATQGPATATNYATSTDISPKHGTFKDYIIGNSADVGLANGQSPQGGLAMMGGGTQLGSATTATTPSPG